MITIDDIVTRLFKVINNTGLKTFKYRHPNNEYGTFVVINMPTLTGIKDQQGFINVNIYTDNTGKDKTTPNASELSRLSDLILPIVNNEWQGNELVDIASQGMFYEQEQTFYNFKLNFRRLNYG